MARANGRLQVHPTIAVTIVCDQLAPNGVKTHFLTTIFLPRWHMLCSRTLSRQTKAVEVIGEVNLMKGRVFAVLFSMACVFAGSIASGQDQKLTGDQIINKHLEAVGGKEAMARFKTRVAVGAVRKENEPEGRLAVMSEASGRTTRRSIPRCFSRENEFMQIKKGSRCRLPFINLPQLNSRIRR